MSTKTLTHWKRLLSGFDLDAIFTTRSIRERAVRLWQEEVCSLETVDTEHVSAQVIGRTGIYQVDLNHDYEGIYYNCTCPSDYQPCKHVGALLYTLKKPPDNELDNDLNDELDEDLYEDDEFDELDEEDFDEDEEQLLFEEQEETEGEEEPVYSPGEILDIQQVESRREEQSIPQDPFSRDAGGDQRDSKISEEAQFRPAFRMVRIPDPDRPFEQVLGIEAVLVYQRKDGNDGRIEKYTPQKTRRPGNAETEDLFYFLVSRKSRSIRATELVSFWYGRSIKRGEDGLSIPVDLFLERAGRLEREQKAVSRRIRTISVHWSAEQYRHGSLGYRPQLVLSDRSGYNESFSAQQTVHDETGELLLISVPATGSLWYLSHIDLEGGYPGQMHTIASLLELRSSFSPEEVEAFSVSCRNGLSPLVEVEEIPRAVRIISLVPTPVVDFVSKRSIYLEINYISFTVSFRYGGTETTSSEAAGLIPIASEEAASLTPPHTSPRGEAADASYFIAPQEKIERHFLRVLCDTLESRGYAPDSFSRFSFQERCAELRHGFIETDIYGLLSSAGDELLAHGFELRVKGEQVDRAPGRPTVRVANSGEDWLELEEGFELDENFLPVEDIPARGLARAGGKTYVLPPGSESEELLSALTQRRVGRRDLTALEDFADQVSNPDHPALQDFYSLRRRLASFSQLEQVEVPASFQGSLRPYQHSGLSWLWFLHSYELGGCLADDMGLGKTIQALALLAKAREAGEMRRALVVCPVSTLGNWKREIETFTPRFSALIHSGQRRAAEPEAFSDWDIVLAGYATVQRDAELFRRGDFDYLILDEAQAIKNPKAKRRRAVASIPAAHRLALTGTPVENSTTELWSLMDTLMPGILGSLASFSRMYGKKIEEGEDHGGDALSKLQRIIRPLILRRTKTAVTPELPPREELVLYAEAGHRQTEVYESLRLRFAEEVEHSISRTGRKESGMKILEAMLRLRQAAILPSLVDKEFSDVPSAKIELLYDRLIELRDEGNKALVFSQFTSVLDEVQHSLTHSGMRLFRLDGSTPQRWRDASITEFQNAEQPAVFLISLKAGGVGINLTAADYVFILDPWWNPAVESQAIDRAHRIGRVGGVLAYRLITTGTIEEKMLRLQERKRQISESLIHGESGALRELSDDDIRGLFQR